MDRARGIIDDFEGRAGASDDVRSEAPGRALGLEDATERAQAPMVNIEHTLHPWTSFLIVPLFALANAGVTMRGELAAIVVEPVFLGVLLGLVMGKQIITLAAWVVVRFGLASLPDGVSWRHVYGAAWLGGIGFTMSLFIAGLAYGGESCSTSPRWASSRRRPSWPASAVSRAPAHRGTAGRNDEADR